jgi:PAS domain S-box-containing protein
MTTELRKTGIGHRLRSLLKLGSMSSAMCRRRSLTRRASVVWGYGLAILSVAAAMSFVLRLNTLPLFFTAILVSAWYGGKGPGLLAAVLSTLGSNLYLNPAVLGLRITSLHDAVYLLIWSLTALPVAWLTAKHREIVDSLRESEAKMEEAQRIAHVGYWENDLDADRITWSDETYHILGLRPHEGFPTAEEFLERIHPEDRQLQAEATARSHRGESRYDVEYRVVRPDDEERTVHSIGDVVLDASGRPCRAFGVMLDITDRKLAEEELRESEKKFRALFESSHDVILFSDRAGNILETNPRAEQLTGYTRSELSRMNIFDDLIIAEDQSIIRQVIRDIFEGRSRTYEERWKTKGGETIWFEGLSVPRLSPKGEVLSTFCTLRDITERKRAEDELRRSERVLREAEELGRTGSWEHNLITGEIFNSEENARMFFGDDSSKGARFEDYPDAVHPDDRVFVIERHAQLLAEGGPRDIEFRVVWPDGSVHVLFGRATVVRDKSGRAVRVYGTNVDITERKRVEEALRKNEQLLQLVLATLPVGVIVVNQAGDIVLGNEASKRIWGGMIVPGRERWAKSTGFWHDSGKRITPTDWASVRALSEGQTSLNELIDIETFDGERKTIQNSVAPIRNAEGLIVGAVIVNENVTERVRAEEELRKSECKFRELFDSTLDGVYQTDASGVFGVMNRAGAKILGYENPEEIIGRDILEYWRDPAERDALISELKSRKSVSAYPIAARKKNGAPIELEASSSIIEDAKGNFLGIEGILRDVTGRKRAEERIYQQLEKLSALRSIDLAISSSLDIRLTLKVFIEQLITQLGVHAANVLLLNPRSGTLEFAASQGFRTNALRHSHLRVGEGYAGMAALEKRLVSIPDLKEANTDFKRLKILEGEDFIAYYGVPLVAKGHVKGVLEIFHRSPLQPDAEWFDFLDSLALQAAIAIDNNSLFYNLERSNMDLTVAYDSTIEGWSRALDYRDKETEGHSQRVTVMTLRIAREMGVAEEELVHVRRGALLHDIGKMGIPDNILLKPGPLTEAEWKIMRLHPVYSYDLLNPIAYLRPALDIPYCHHEKWDGSGYPRGLKAEQIPLSARIFAVIDVWDALRSDRPYRPAWGMEKAKEYIQSLAGIQFDPKVVRAFMSAIEEGKD